MEKKDSVFAGLNPAPVPSPAQPPAPRPPVPDQEISALKQKIEAMEKSIVAQLEKKISETFKALAPAPSLPPSSEQKPPGTNAQLVLARLGELDQRLEDFVRRAMVSSTQMKNLEESGISARCGIDDLLKIVREHQKHFEFDRQVHDQLEKSWLRVEELEKKMMDFYSSIQARRREEEDGTGLLLKGLGGRLEAMAAGFERNAQAVETRLLAVDAAAASAAGLKNEIMSELKRIRDEAQDIGREQSAVLKAMFEMQGSVTAELERSRRDASAELELFKKELLGPR
jgi:hypothetical protein